MALRNVVVAGAAAALLSAQQASAESNRANPIRRVVTMMQSMAKKVEAEGEAEEKLYAKFFCYCESGASSLGQSIAAAETKIPQLESSIKATAAELEQLGGGTTKAKADRADAKTAIAEATGIRTKEAADYAGVKAESETNIAAMAKALVALEKGAAGSFLQTSAANVLTKISMNMDMDTSDRDILTSFLSTGSSQSGEIIGVLKQLKETMEGDLAAATKTEEQSISDFDGLVAAKSKEIAALTKSLEESITRTGEAGVELENMKEDLEDTSASLAEDKKFLADMDKNCAQKKAEQEERAKMRGEELVAISETIKILNDDDALDLFKKTLPGASASLLQMETTAKEMKRRALAVLAGHKRKGDTRLDLISLALSGKKVNFDKVIGMIDAMVKLLGNEQNEDDAKKAYCGEEIDKTEDEIKALKQNIADLEKSAEDAKGLIDTLVDEIAALAAGVAALDKEVSAATETRKEENEEYKSTLAANTAAVDLLGVAKNRMNKFYNPKMYKAAPKRELSEEERIAVNMGGTAPPTPAPGGIAGTGISAFVQIKMHRDEEAQPETPGAYKKKGAESTGVIAMIDLLVADVEKDIQTMEVDEKNAQEEYEQFMGDSKEKRAADTKSLAEKEGAKAEAEANLGKVTEDHTGTSADLMGKGEQLSALHADCDFLLQSFDMRKEARAGEVDSLKKAKAVLSGADYSLLQKTTREHRALRGSN
jgi:hypothetical protein